MGAALNAIPPVVNAVVGAVPVITKAIRGDKTNNVQRIEENKGLLQALQNVERNRNDIDRLIENQDKLLEALMLLLQRLQEWEGKFQLQNGVFNQLNNGYQQIMNGTNAANGPGKIRIEMDLPDGAEEREAALQNFWRSMATIANSQITSHGPQLALADEPWEGKRQEGRREHKSEKTRNRPQNYAPSLSHEEQTKIAIQFSLEEQEAADYRMAMRLQKQENSSHCQNFSRKTRNFENSDRFNTANVYKEEEQDYRVTPCSYEEERGLTNFKHNEDFDMRANYPHTNDGFMNMHRESQRYGMWNVRPENWNYCSSFVPSEEEKEEEDDNGCWDKQDEWKYGAMATVKDDQEEQDFRIAQMLQAEERRLAKLNDCDSDDENCGPEFRF